MERTFQLYLYDTNEFRREAIPSSQRTRFFTSLASLNDSCRLWDMQIERNAQEYGFQLRIATRRSPKKRVLGAYYAHQIRMFANIWGLGAQLKEDPEAWVIYVGLPKKSPRLAETSLAKSVRGVEFSDYVFFEQWSRPAKEEDLEKIGFSALFYALKFSMPETQGFPWRFILQRDTIEFYRFGNSSQTVYREAGALMAAFAQLMAQEGLSFTWRIAPRYGEYRFYAGMAMLEKCFSEFELA